MEIHKVQIDSFAVTENTKKIPCWVSQALKQVAPLSASANYTLTVITRLGNAAAVIPAKALN